MVKKEMKVIYCSTEADRDKLLSMGFNILKKECLDDGKCYWLFILDKPIDTLVFGSNKIFTTDLLKF